MTEKEKEKEKKCLNACYLGNIDVVTKILKDKNFDINCVLNEKFEETPINRTGLCFAVDKRHTELVKLLLSYNIDVNKGSVKSGNSPLYNAILRSSIELVKMLLLNENISLEKKYFSDEEPEDVIGNVNYIGRKILELLKNFRKKKK